MTRLVTFGCSLTYGQYLDDRDTQSWPAQLAKILSVDVINISEPGASNKKILYNILDFDFQPDDICVIVWTNPYRWVLYTEDEEINLGAWQNTPRALAFVEHFWDEHDMCLDILEKASHAHRHIPVKSYHVISGNTFLLEPRPNWSCATWLDIDFQKIRDSHPKASDGKHPGPLAYKDFALMLYNIIKK